MALPAWPDVNHYVLRDAFQQSQIANPTLRTDMNAGTTLQRRKFTVRIAIQKIVMQMTAAELAVFQAFYETTLGDGAARFTMPVWNGSAYVTRNVAIKTDEGVTYEPVNNASVRVGFTVLIENL